MKQNPTHSQASVTAWVRSWTAHGQHMSSLPVFKCIS